MNDPRAPGAPRALGAPRAPAPITADDLERRLAGLEAIGVRADGVWRLAWTDEDRETREWFAEQARDIGLTVRRDPAGNLWACPAADPPWIGLGSHLDSVRGGGRFDGPLGVACAFEIARAHADKGRAHADEGRAQAEERPAPPEERPPPPIAVISFADEEGARFNTPTFGSKALAGRLDLPAVLDRTDDGGTALADAMRAAGVDPDGLASAPEWRARLGAFVEIHIDQTTELARAGAPIGIVTSLAPRRRLEVELRGRADHAGTTPRAERADALLAAARLIVAADELGEEHALTVTTARMEVEPNAPTTIASRVRLWIDARGGEGGAIERWQAALEQRSAELPVQASVTVASRSDGVGFDHDLRRALHDAARRQTGEDPPDLVCMAGHDAGVLAPTVSAAMVFVRNETGVSHAPEEDVDLEDAALAARAVLDALPELSRP